MFVSLGALRVFQAFEAFKWWKRVSLVNNAHRLCRRRRGKRSTLLPEILRCKLTRGHGQVFT